MMNESNGTIIIDEIDRLFVVYDKAKEYLKKISSGIDQQIDLWQYRRQIIVDQMKSTSSVDFLLPKTQRINELTIEAVQALCRVDLLMEQILRIDPKSLSQSRSTPSATSFSARSINTNNSQSATNTTLSRDRHPVSSPSFGSFRQQSNTDSISNGKTFAQNPLPIPVLRSQQQTPSSRLSAVATHEKAGFKPIEQQSSSIIPDNTSRPTPIHPQTNSYQASGGFNLPRSIPSAYETRTSQSDHITSPPMSHTMPMYHQAPRAKAKVKLQRISPGTIWRQAKIDVIDSLFAFYVENRDPKIHDKYTSMMDDLHDYYNNLEQSNKLMPLENISVGDFGVSKYSEDNRWYRARLLMLEENDRIKIVFIDFGNIETKFFNEFFPLDELYTDLPAQAIACTLSDAFPRNTTEDEIVWPQDTIQIFRNEVVGKTVRVVFANSDEVTAQWPLHFVTITVGNQTVTNSLSLKQRIEPQPNRIIAEQLSKSLTPQEYILFNVPIGDDELDNI